MKTTLLSLLALFVFIGCASNDRRIASVEGSNCFLKKHKSKDYYKVYYNNSPLYEHWYDKSYAQSLLNRSVQKGKCE